jgi:hypothetical protein
MAAFGMVALADLSLLHDETSGEKKSTKTARETNW